MKVTYEDSLSYKLEQRIDSLLYNVILRADFADLGGERQLSYAVKQLIKRKKIARIGYGIYAKTESSAYSDTLLLKEPNGFAGTIREALDRLNISWQQSEAEEDYNAGISTQIPVRSILRLKTRFRGKLVFGGMKFQYKKVS